MSHGCALTGRLVSRRQRSRGQAMVEFALVAPIFFLVIFAFVEFALISTSIGSYNFAAKEGARLGSFLGRTNSTADQAILTQINQQINGVVMAKLVKVEIFRSDPLGNILTDVNGVPQEDVYVASSGTWTTLDWPVDVRNDSLISGDYLGVRITYQYTYLTSVISGGLTGITLTALSVQRIEPQDYQGYHAAPAHAIARAPVTMPPVAWQRGPGTGGSA